MWSRNVVYTLLLAMMLSACSDNTDDTAVTVTQPLALSTYYPPLNAGYNHSEIAVHGRIEYDLESPPLIMVDGGAGPAEATIAADGTWIAERVPLADSDTVSITVSVTENGALLKEEVVSTLYRIDAGRSAPTAVAPVAEQGGVFVKFTGGDIRQYRADGTERQRFSFELDEVTSHAPLEVWPATGELVFMSTPETGGCVVNAYNLENSQLRALLSLDWDSPFTMRTCSNATFSSAIEERALAIYDKARQRLTVLNTDGTIRTATDFPPTDWNITELLPMANQPQQFAVLSDYSFLDTALRYTTIDSISGTQLSRIEYPLSIFRYSSVPPLATLSGESVYMWLDGVHYLLSTLSDNSEIVPATGLIPVDIVDVSSDSTSGIYHLDGWGRVSKFDVASGRSQSIVDVAPFRQPPIRFYDQSTDSDSIFIGTEHVLFGPGPRGGTVRSWQNLHQFDLESLSYQPVFGTGAFVDSFAPVSRTFFSVRRTPAALISKDFSLQRVTDFEHRLQLRVHETGEQTVFDLGELVLSEQDEFVVGAGGEFLVVFTADGIYEYNIERQELSRSMLFDSTPGSITLAARFPGEDGAIYFTDMPFFNLYRADFESQGFVEVSGLGVGEGPQLGALLDPSIASWSPQDNAAYFGVLNTTSFVRVDLSSGARSVVFLQENATDFELPEGPDDVHYLPGRDALLVSSEAGVFYLDLRTSSSAAIPMHPAR